jgi:hypothetical protein
VLEQFTRCIRLEKPDVVGLIEVDTGRAQAGQRPGGRARSSGVRSTSRVSSLALR